MIRTIFKAFNFYIPFAQLIRFSKNKSRYNSHPLYQQIVKFLLSKEFMHAIQVLA